MLQCGGPRGSRRHVSAGRGSASERAGLKRRYQRQDCNGQAPEVGESCEKNGAQRPETAAGTSVRCNRRGKRQNAIVVTERTWSEVLVRQVCTHVSHIGRVVCTGSRVVACMVLLMASSASACDDDERERTMLFNTRGLAVSGAVATGIFFAATAKLKLAFLESTIEGEKVKSGVLLELICSRAQAKLLINWFRARRMTLRILPGESRESRAGENEAVWTRRVPSGPSRSGD